MDGEKVDIILVANKESLNKHANFKQEAHLVIDSCSHGIQDTLSAIIHNSSSDYCFVTHNADSFPNELIDTLFGELTEKKAQLCIRIHHDYIFSSKQEAASHPVLRYPNWCCSPQNALYELLTAFTPEKIQQCDFLFDKKLLKQAQGSVTSTIGLSLLYTLISNAERVCFCTSIYSQENAGTDATFPGQGLIDELACRQEACSTLLNAYPKLESSFYTSYYNLFDRLKEAIKEDTEEQLDTAYIKTIKKKIAPFFRHHIHKIKKYNQLPSHTYLATNVFLVSPKIYAQIF